jgi:addiction module HigA family antidote
MSELINQYAPDSVSPPGDTLLDILEERGMSQAELARRMGRPTKTINEIARGKAAITPGTALQLERVLDIPAAFWNNREQQYRQYLARVEEEARLRQQIDWAAKFPVKAMVKLGWIDAISNELQQVIHLLQFFAIASPQQWETVWAKPLVNYRKTKAFASSPYALSAWLRQGERIAQEMQCASYRAQTFRDLLAGSIRGLTQLPPEQFQESLVKMSAEAGVAVVFLPQIPKARVSGATRWLAPDKALIQLSLRYKKDDHFWFTFFHEAGHLLLHGKRDIFLETEESVGDEEKEADQFAARMLIPPDKLRQFVQQNIRPGRSPSHASAQRFAQEIGVSPGIVVGRLQHDGHLPYTHLNKLKQTFVWGG